MYLASSKNLEWGCLHENLMLMPLQGQAPDSYANLGSWHVVVYGPEGRALYDVSGFRIKVVEWNQAPNGTYFQKKEIIRKFLKGVFLFRFLKAWG